MDLRGKLALTEENPANIKWLLVKAGALGAINTFTENPGLADGRQWINAWGDDGWAFTKTEHAAAVILDHAAPDGVDAQPAGARAGPRQGDRR